MKIDDRIINYEIGNQVSKPGADQTEKVDGKKASEAKDKGEQAAVQQDTVVHLSQTSREVAW